MAVLLVFLLMLISGLGQETPTDPIRDTLMKAQLGESADEGLGAVMDVLFVKFVNVFPRMSVWSVRDGESRVVFNAPKKVELASIDTSILSNMSSLMSGDMFSDMPEPAAFPAVSGFNMETINAMVAWGRDALVSYTSYFGTKFLIDDRIPDFYQGVFFTCLGAIIPLVIMCIWDAMLCCTCIYCCVCCCCVNKDKKEEDLRLDDREKWRARFKRKKCTQKCCRAFIFVYSIATLVIMGIWGLFAYQSHIGLSNTIDGLNEDYDGIRDYAMQLANFPTTIQDATTIISDTLNNAIEAVLDIIPIDEMIDSAMACIDEIMDGLPDIAAIRTFLDDVNATLNSIGDFDQYEAIAGNISYWIDKMMYEDIESMINIVDTAVVDTSLLQDDLDEIWAQLEYFDNFYPDVADMNYMYDALNTYKTERDTVLTLDYLTGMLDSLMPLTHNARPSDEVAANLTTLYNSIMTLSAFSSSQVNSTMNSIVDRLQTTPNFTGVLDLVLQMNTNMEDALTTAIDLELGLLGLNASLTGLLDYIDTDLPSEMQAFNQSVLDMIPDFGPLMFELDKILTIGENATCIDDFMDQIYEINNTLIILPAEYLDMLDMFGNITEFLNFDIDFDSILGDVTGMTETINGQLQDAFDLVWNTTSGAVLDSLPSLDDFDLDFDALSINMTDGILDFNVTELESHMNLANQSLESSKAMLAFTEDLGDALDAMDILVAVAPMVNTTRFQYELVVPPSNPCGALCPDYATEVAPIYGALYMLKEAFYGPDAADLDSFLAEFVTFNASRTSLPTTDEYGSEILLVNSTINDIPDMAWVRDQLVTANQTIETSLPFDEFAGYIDDFADQIAGFDLSSLTGNLDFADDMYNQFNVTDLFGDFTGLMDSVTPMFDMIPNLLDGVVGQVGFINTTMGQVIGFLDTVDSMKNDFLDNYVYRFDGYRLLIALFLTLIFIPIPALTIFACCCYKKPCILICCGRCLVFLSIMFWILPIFGIPLGVLMDDACENIPEYINDGIGVAANVVEQAPIEDLIPLDNFTALSGPVLAGWLRDGITADDVNGIISQLSDTYLAGALDGLSIPGLDVNLTDLLDIQVNFPDLSIQQFVTYYLDDEAPCVGPDPIEIAADVFNTTAVELMNAMADLLPSLSLPMGFKFHPNFGTVVRDTFAPTIGDLVTLGDLAQPYVGCARVNEMYDIGYGLVCRKFRFSFMFLWGMMIIAAIIMTTVSLMSCISYCFLENSYTKDVHDSNFGLDEYEDRDASSDEWIDDGL